MKAVALPLIVLLLGGCVSTASDDVAGRMTDWPFSAANREAMREADLRLAVSETPVLRLWVLPSFSQARVITVTTVADGMQGKLKVSRGEGGYGLRGVAHQRSFSIPKLEVTQIEAVLQKMGARLGKVPEEYVRPDGSMWLDGTTIVFEFAGPEGYHRFQRHAGDIDTLAGLEELVSMIMKAAGQSPDLSDW